MSIQQFAAREGLVAERLYRWSRKLRSEDKPPFVEVAPRTVAVVSHPSVEVVLQSGLTVRAPESSDVEFVARLVDALERQRMC